jgi:hypothetical protein
MRIEAATIPFGGPVHAGGAAGSSPGKTVRFKLRRIARRYASDRSVESGWSIDWILMAKAEPTPKNRPACADGQRGILIRGLVKTYKDQGDIEIFVVLPHIVVVVLYRFSFIHSVKVDAGVFALDWRHEHA